MQDLRFAIRLLVKDRWFTAAAVLALALGIGANTIVFTIINGWNLQDLPVDEGDRIVAVASRDAQGRRRGVSYLDFVDWRSASRSLSGLAAQWQPWRLARATTRESVSAWSAAVPSGRMTDCPVGKPRL